jgi:hypothetical protein
MLLLHLYIKKVAKKGWLSRWDAAGYRGTSLITCGDSENACLFLTQSRNFAKNACLFLDKLRNFFKNACLFLKKLRNFPKTACLFLKKSRNFLPEKRLFLIRTVSYERGTPVPTRPSCVQPHRGCTGVTRN